MPVRMQASSPDEAALVIAAKVFGFFFHYRAPATVAVREPVPHDTAGPSAGARADIDAEYTILAVLEFNSTRKRQSVVVRQPDGSILLQCKARRQSALCVLTTIYSIYPSMLSLKLFTCSWNTLPRKCRLLTTWRWLWGQGFPDSVQYARQSRPEHCSDALCIPQGADSVIYERLSPEGRRFAGVTLDHLEEFGNQGLRTLCLAYRHAAGMQWPQLASPHKNMLGCVDCPWIGDGHLHGLHDQGGRSSAADYWSVAIGKTDDCGRLPSCVEDCSRCQLCSASHMQAGERGGVRGVGAGVPGRQDGAAGPRRGAGRRGGADRAGPAAAGRDGDRGQAAGGVTACSQSVHLTFLASPQTRDPLLQRITAEHTQSPLS